MHGPPSASHDAIRPPGVPKARLDAVAATLEVLASRPRLELLHVLRTPRALSEIRVTASRARADERADRPLTRQAITKHIEVLLDAELVRRIPSPDSRGGDRYVVNHERVFAFVDGVRELAKLRPRLAERPPGPDTLDGKGDTRVDLPPGPRLLVAYGRDDGVALPLEGGVGTRWRIGRSPACEISLDYDPFLSGVHATLDRDADGFRLRDTGSRNGTAVNWTRLPRGGVTLLAPGDMITVGRSNLVFQP